VIFGGAITPITVEGIPTSVVNLVHKYKSNSITDEGIPAYDVMFGGAIILRSMV
jgi:hypothetical protein